MWELVKAGGWLMLPLILCSIFTVAISIERFIRLKRSAVLPSALMSSSSHSVDQVIVQLQQNQAFQTSPLGRILKAGIENQSMGEQFAKAQMEVTASQEIGYLERNINFLGTMSAVAPLLGLLGTVVGIIESFLVIDIGSSSSPTLMIPGISKALITTAVGMLIAIPALMAYRYFQRLVHEYIAELEQQATLFHAALFFKSSQSNAFEQRRVG
ncbi:MotA/TolQ/ExbB proton channel family protein [Acinetobacter ursingii]|uniref:MotA/TolQ/ExbB proton channel family protein n=1 Tax=Acinetobacter ursingii TaxID=108980 RepID=UPI00124DCAEE|nr:MotA/TolQ/ExbB proton channel family protein [Acinetobacter ursingii]MEC8056054.1 MotA/TolQ/ExbB proton channel family protein [Pseudomonadota bacterium]NOZ96853.1 MotA/TolQ/ExbB proton channel family protein [Gammaproteobacteria bacterium]MCU4490454.1 MotA/TolQ/ExbB proton channel family protein [Acinetobacter ursingii]MCU4601954.1 MotA/TolQ/ExbB proton channel family protein [Acinetobacter ursingii]MDG9859334.1 MotA/TolQ/ExbB proton channel family protein [Acinetobacter ursingii]